MNEQTKKHKRTAVNVNIDLRHIKAALTKAVDWGYIDFNSSKNDGESFLMEKLDVLIDCRNDFVSSGGLIKIFETLY